MNGAAPDDDIAALLDEYRAARRAFQTAAQSVPHQVRLVPLDGGRSARDIVALVAAWLEEANDRIPRLLAGAPRVTYDVDAVNAAAVARASGWTYEQTLGAFRRTSDHFETIVAETDAADLLGSDDAMCWLRHAARALMTEHLGDLTPSAAGSCATAIKRAGGA